MSSVFERQGNSFSLERFLWMICSEYFDKLLFTKLSCDWIRISFKEDKDSVELNWKASFLDVKS